MTRTHQDERLLADSPNGTWSLSVDVPTFERPDRIWPELVVKGVKTRPLVASECVRVSGDFRRCERHAADATSPVTLSRVSLARAVGVQPPTRPGDRHL
jgi:hypothetical protein